MKTTTKMEIDRELFKPANAMAEGPTIKERPSTREILGISEKEDTRRKAFSILIEEGKYPSITPGDAMALASKFARKYWYAADENVRLASEEERYWEGMLEAAEGNEVQTRFVKAAKMKIESATAAVCDMEKRYRDSVAYLDSEEKERREFWIQAGERFGWKSITSQIGAILTSVGISTAHFTSWFSTLGRNGIIYITAGAAAVYVLLEGVINGFTFMMKRQANKSRFNKENEALATAKKEKERILAQLARSMLGLCSIHYPAYYLLLIDINDAGRSEKQKREEIIERLKKDHLSDFSIDPDAGHRQAGGNAIN